MATYRYTTPIAELGSGTGGADVQSQIDALYGRDIWLDLGSPKGPNLIVTPAGDWKTVGGREALRQSLLRRFITDPGEWQTKPGYGAGLKSAVKKKMTEARRLELQARCREQALQDPRVAAVETVTVNGGDGKLSVGVKVIPVAEPKRALSFGIEVTA